MVPPGTRTKKIEGKKKEPKRGQGRKEGTKKQGKGKGKGRRKTTTKGGKTLASPTQATQKPGPLIPFRVG